MAKACPKGANALTPCRINDTAVAIISHSAGQRFQTSPANTPTVTTRVIKASMCCAISIY